MVNVPRAASKPTHSVPGVDVMMQASVAKPIGIAKLERNTDKARGSLAPSKAQDDARDGEVGPDNVGQYQSS